MENAIDALKMAAAVLIFVLALSISINAFGEARKTAQLLIDNQDREYDTTYISGEGETQRTVGVETIIPSIYRAYKENYKIVFQFKNGNDYDKALYQKKDENGNMVNIYAIDLETPQQGIASDAEKEKFIETILYAQNHENERLEYQKKGIFLKRENFYDKIKNKTFIEKLGVYYQEEVVGESQDTPDSNKTKKRVITYVEN